jgi:NTP pyrophosphatase (non-canonical NTP hydrolase)
MEVKEPWTQERISQWGRETFGTPGSALSLVRRASEEMDELYSEAIYHNNEDKAYVEVDKILQEAADVVIILTQMVDNLGGNLQAEINKKMEINVKRTWIKSGDGIGYHA